jgi:hypothetical protein
MNPFKRQIYKFGLIEDNDENPPIVDDNFEEYTSGVFQFDTIHFTNNFQDPDLDSYKLTRIRTLPLVGTLEYENEPVEVGFVFNLDNISQLTYELPDNYMISSNGYCKFDKPIDTIISEQSNEGFELTSLGNGTIEFEKITESLLPNDTDIYAFFDATSMEIEDATAAKNSLEEWYNQFKSDNTSFTGKLYILPIIKENWLDFPNIIVRGSSDRIKNNPDRPNDDFMALSELPLDFDTTSNSINDNWTKPSDVVTLAFVDESNPGYHKDRNGYGFDGQPSSQYLTDYRNFISNYNSFNFFKGILYPIPNIEEDNYNNVGNAMVLQGLAAIEGKSTYNLTEIEALGVTFANERRFHWHLDPTSPYYTGTHLTVANPYSAEAKTKVTNTNYNLQGLKNFGWTGVYDKDQPASSVFSSDTFNSDLNKYLQGSVTESVENRIIKGDCITSGSICFDFQTSDDSVYTLFSNIATFCLTGTDDQVQQANPPTVESVIRQYDKELYQVILEDFTNNFQDVDGDSYEDVKLLTGFKSDKGITIKGLEEKGLSITYPLTKPLTEVLELKYQIPETYYLAKDRLYKFTDTLTTLITNIKNQGYALFDNKGDELIYTKLNTSDSQNPTVETQKIKGNDIGGRQISLSFKTSDDSDYKLYSNTATLTLEMKNDNTAPTVEGWSDVVSTNEYSFTQDMFTTNYQDSEGDLSNSVKIIDNIITPIGTLQFKGYPITTPFAFNIGESTDLKFITTDRFVYEGEDIYSFDKSITTIINEHITLGYTLVSNAKGVMLFDRIIDGKLETKYVVGNTLEAKEYCFEFSVSDDNEIPLFSNTAKVCLTLPDVETETEVEFNFPPTVGDNTIEL